MSTNFVETIRKTHGAVKFLKAFVAAFEEFVRVYDGDQKQNEDGKI